MKLPLLTLGMLAVAVGCGPTEAEKQNDWKMDRVWEMNAATSDMYACAAEVWTVENGPACKKACREYRAIRNLELNPPAEFAGVIHPDQILESVEDDGICKDSEKPERKRKW